MMKSKKKTKEKAYITPDFEVIQIELEYNILQASGTGESQQLNDFNWEDW